MDGAGIRAEREGSRLPGPKSREQLCPEALRALDDFEFFRRRYMGHVSTPWQVETAYRVVELLATPDKEFVVENCPPGGGKTTLAHDIAAWCTARNRRLRGLFGSRIENNATRQLRRLRRTLERTKPLRAKPEDIARGLAADAAACMAADFGTFKPVTSDVWRADEFLVAQLDDEVVDEKEPTWSSYGMNSGQLGNRFELIFWDDVVDKATIRTLDAILEQRSWWDDEAETRLEPGGVLFLIGQRMASQDLYRHCLDKRVDVDEDDVDVDGEDPEVVDTDGAADEYRPRIYHHVVYRAHYEELCQGAASHGRDAPAWPDGCLLDPHRLPWSGSGGLRAIQATKAQTFRVSYQQEDVDPDQVLAKDVWVWGGVDPETGEMAPGCTDDDRDLCELPKGLKGPKVSAATVDPSGKKMWACQWWVHTPDASAQSFLMDLERKAMPANQLLDWDENNQRFYGLMEEWQARSVEMGIPITHWIVEVNAAQRYLLAYDHVRRWMAKWKVSIIPHTTSSKKLDQDYGPWITRDEWKFGRIRLPMKQGLANRARIQSLKLVGEATRWPNASTTDDEVMAHWFFFLWLPTLVKIVRRAEAEERDREEKRPGWMDRLKRKAAA